MLTTRGAAAGPSDCSAVLLNFENSNQKVFVLTVQAMDGGDMSAQAAITVSVTDVNEAPFFMDATLLRSIDENCARSPRSAGGPVGAIIAVTDPDTLWTPRQALTYSIVSGKTALASSALLRLGVAPAS